LFTNISDTSAVSEAIAARTAPGSTRPAPSTGNTVARNPSDTAIATASSTALCSVAWVITWPPGSPAARRARNTPRIARLSASVAPDVNTTSRAWQPTHRATAVRAASTASRADAPARCERDEAFAARTPNHGNIASTTCGRHGVVAWWSRYAGRGPVTPRTTPRRSSSASPRGC
jgi:hypothetical protein